MTEPAHDEASAAVVGYRLLLPPGWCRIPLRHDTDSAVDALLEPNLAQVPPDKRSFFREALRRRLDRRITDARDNGGLDLYLPAGPVHDTLIAASVIVSEIVPGGGDVPSAHVMSALVAGEPEATLATLDGAPALRAERVVPGSAPTPPGGMDVASEPPLPGDLGSAIEAMDEKTVERGLTRLTHEGEGLGSRRVEYTVAVPGRPNRWLIAAFSTPGDGDPASAFSDLLVDLFDAMMTTWRWAVDSPGAPSHRPTATSG